MIFASLFCVGGGGGGGPPTLWKQLLCQNARYLDAMSAHA